MAEIEIRLPKMGESVTEATITNWIKNIGDSVAMDEALVEVATDKVDNELPSEAAGILVKRFFEKDQVAQVGDVIAIISTEGGATESVGTTVQKTELKIDVPALEAVYSNGNQTSISSDSDKFYSPLVKSIAAKENIGLAELDSLTGTGKDGRVTKNDMISYLAVRGNIAIETPKPAKELQQFESMS